jgi:MFS family permease
MLTVDRIILRSFQGLGASGVFSVSSVMLYEMVPKEKLPMYGALAFTIVALATVIGPLMGGAIDNNTTWRWIFLIKYVSFSVLLFFFRYPIDNSLVSLVSLLP